MQVKCSVVLTGSPHQTTPQTPIQRDLFKLRSHSFLGCLLLFVLVSVCVVALLHRFRLMFITWNLVHPLKSSLPL